MRVAPARSVATRTAVSADDSRTKTSMVSSSAPGEELEPDVLRLRDVAFTFPDGTQALDGISCAVQRGMILGVVGPSGCGKSTLLSVLAGLRAPSDGTVERNYRGDRHALSMVFQADTLAPWLTVEENARFFAKFRVHGQRRGRLATVVRRVRGGTAANRAEDERLASLLRMVHLDGQLHAYPYQLSGGMRRRLQFLSGIAPEPEILLLDEPFSSVDEPTRVALHQDVFEVVRALGTTTILVTHDLAEAVTLCDRVLILSNRPARVAAVHEIPFGAERDVLGIRGSQQFLDLYGRLWDDLSEQIRATPQQYTEAAVDR